MKNDISYCLPHKDKDLYSPHSYTLEYLLS